MNIRKLIESVVLASAIMFTSTTGHAALAWGSITTTVNGGAFDGAVGDLDFHGNISGSGVESLSTFNIFDFEIFGQHYGVSDDIGTATIHFLDGFATSVDFTILDLNPTDITEAGVNDISFSGDLTLVTNATKKSYSGNVVVNAAVVPLPASAWLFASGLLGLVGMQRRRKG